jgi:hypothetical protein
MAERHDVTNLRTKAISYSPGPDVHSDPLKRERRGQSSRRVNGYTMKCAL